MKKNKERNETLYRMTMCAVKRMLKDGLISAGEYKTPITREIMDACPDKKI